MPRSIIEGYVPSRYLGPLQILGNFAMQAPVISALLVLAALGQRNVPVRSGYGTIQADEVSYQKQAFKQWWGDDLVMKFDDLPVEGKVADSRVPYSGHDYPDRAGGTINSLSKYDRAFHSGRGLATEFERQDVNAHRGGRPDGEPFRGGGLFARIRANRARNAVPGWYGHCNGWTAAAIRHAEPQKSVVRNGVTFTPADIKGLLAEIYMYADSEFLGGVDPAINPATLHLTLANWLGRGSHPVGVETAVGEVVINYPIFAYKSKITKLSDRQADVRMTVTYALNINREQDKGPPNYNRTMGFHYVLDLDDDGSIRGGRYYGDSAQVDMLWTPLKPAQGGQEKNKRGNPHLDVKEVLAIWRESVPEDLRNAWLNIDPTEEDRVLTEADKAAIAAAEASKPAADAAKPAGEAAVATTAPALPAANSATPVAADGGASSSAAAAPASPSTPATDSEAASAAPPAPPAGANGTDE